MRPNSFIMRPSPFVLDMRLSHNWCKCDPEGQGFAWRVYGYFLAEKCWGAKGKLWIGAWKEWVRGRVGWGRLRLGDRGGGGRSWWFDGRRRGHPSGSPSVESISRPLSLWVPSPNSRQAARLPRASPCPRPEQLPRLWRQAPQGTSPDEYTSGA